MQLPNAKELAKLAKACRAAGIQTFKGGGIEFTLSDHLPETKAARKAAETDNKAPTNEDEPSYESLLHWSVMDLDKESKES